MHHLLHGNNRIGLPVPVPLQEAARRSHLHRQGPPAPVPGRQPRDAELGPPGPGWPLIAIVSEDREQRTEVRRQKSKSMNSRHLQSMLFSDLCPLTPASRPKTQPKEMAMKALRRAGWGLTAGLLLASPALAQYGARLPGENSPTTPRTATVVPIQATTASVVNLPPARQPT